MSATVGFYSPMPPARTGVADYSAALLAGLRPYGRVKVAPRRCDVALYHLGNNSLHAEIYVRALERPGVAVLHDAVLNHFLLGQLNETEYVEEFAYNYGDWQRTLARDLWRWRGGAGADRRYFEWPMLSRVCRSSLAVVVHNPAARAAVLAHAPEARVVEIPHLFAMPSLPAEGVVMRYRQRLGVEPGDFLFGVFGYLRESKRLTAVGEAFAKVRREISRARLLIAGSFASSDLERAAVDLISEPGVVRLPHLSEREFWLAASAVDACINLRYPSTGESSGIAIRLMGIGKPVLVTDAPECGRFPEDACVRVASGLAERESLRVHMILLASMPELSGEIGRRAARHIQGCHGVEEVARRYWEVLSAAGSR